VRGLRMNTFGEKGLQVGVATLLSPFPGFLISHSYPGLAPWAAFCRRFAAWFGRRIFARVERWPDGGSKSDLEIQLYLELDSARRAQRVHA
jgi:hypothetical protein